MRVRLISVLSILMSMMVTARAQDAETEVVQQVSAVQAHLRASEPQSDRHASAVPTLARLVGKLLSEQLKDVRIEWEPVAGQTQSPGMQQQGVLHLNRRAEICYDNYRIGFKRDGVAMRYELTF
ncbi:MAG: hypothetical protein EPO09_01350 [Aquabacterium sp.]|uniref:hypothetical protein n=1 Tax=Aquabacterium sp. TaxID=1872578 RepID=UPI00121027A6|nr:hypothetical protein [Aquabacterium sp.]TAK99315.1 MAG: hypothetical protein EPO09_01350 [Aquabacterium sp.]